MRPDFQSAMIQLLRVDFRPEAADKRLKRWLGKCFDDRGSYRWLCQICGL